MGSLSEASGLTELSINPIIFSVNVIAYQPDSYWDENRFLGSMGVYIVSRIDLLVVVPRNFVR